MAAVLRIKLADLLTVLVADLSPRPDGPKPEQRSFTQLKLIGFRPGARPKKPADMPGARSLKSGNPKIRSESYEQDLRVIQKYLRGGPASRDDLEFKLNMTDSAVRHRLAVLKARGVIEYRSDNTYSLGKEEPRAYSPMLSRARDVTQAYAQIECPAGNRKKEAL